MAVFIPVPYKPIPPGATAEDRRALYADHMRRLAAANPPLYHPDGTERSIFSWLGWLFWRSK